METNTKIGKSVSVIDDENYYFLVCSHFNNPFMRPNSISFPNIYTVKMLSFIKRISGS